MESNDILDNAYKWIRLHSMELGDSDVIADIFVYFVPKCGRMNTGIISPPHCSVNKHNNYPALWFMNLS